LNWKIAEDGELVIKHPGVFHGYIHDSGATAKTVVDGWLQYWVISSSWPTTAN